MGEKYSVSLLISTITIAQLLSLLSRKAPTNENACNRVSFPEFSLSTNPIPPQLRPQAPRRGQLARWAGSG
jgi:hypothetical protein